MHSGTIKSVCQAARKCLHAAMARAVGPTQNGVRRGGIKSKQLSCERGSAGALSATCVALKWGPWKTRRMQSGGGKHTLTLYYSAVKTCTVPILIYTK